jgi:hypothetical protein
VDPGEEPEPPREVAEKDHVVVTFHAQGVVAVCDLDLHVRGAASRGRHRVRCDDGSGVDVEGRDPFVAAATEIPAARRTHHRTSRLARSVTSITCPAARFRTGA